ncbi:MAG: biosynthetic-type acetolactate synthase large subunit [Burkholderiales bacterium]|nr:biosynthetic-type acetolactate synthase large subunit [Burkholderiales bacterium]
MEMTGAQVLVRSLLQMGVDTVFGYPGGAIMPVYDALFNEDGLRHILVRHEQGAAIAAEGYAKALNKVGVCIATSGPGATNLVTGIADAMLDSIPIVCITGQVNSFLIGTDAFQEADIIGMTLPITKWNYQISKATEIQYIISKAFHIAISGRPGPVLIDITKDAQQELLQFDLSQINVFDYSPDLIDEKFYFKAAQLINQAQRPFILAGHGITIAEAEAELEGFINLTGIPVACTLLGLSAVNPEHHLYVGMLGMHGNYAPNILTNEADLIIAVGMRFDDRVTGSLKSYAVNAKVIHIDIDRAELNKNVKADVPICGDAKVVLNQLKQHVIPRNHDSWVKRFKELYQIEHEVVISNETQKKDIGLIKMAEVINLLSKKTDGNAIIVSDVGQNQMTVARYYDFKNPRSHITSGGLGTMGYALPAGIGAKVAKPNTEVIVVCGDGGIQMNIQELAVIAQENLNLKIIILNNEYLGMVRQWQELFFDKRYSFTELLNPNFQKIAEAYSIPSLRVDDHSLLSQGIDQLLQAKTSFLLEVMVEKQGKVFPMVEAGSGVGDVRLQ